jgi:hypothetical protein
MLLSPVMTSLSSRLLGFIPIPPTMVKEKNDDSGLLAM